MIHPKVILQLKMQYITFIQPEHWSSKEEEKKAKWKENHIQKCEPYLFKFLADECECLKNGICWSCDCNNAFRARAIRDVDFST